METQRSQIAQAILRKKNGGIRLPDFRLYYKAMVIKTLWYWNKNRNKDPWNRIESSDYLSIDMWGYFYDKEGKNIQWIKDSNARKTGPATCKRIKLEL